MKNLIKGLAGAAIAVVAAASGALAQEGDPIKIALIRSKTGLSEIYARDTERGFKLGLEYLTDGTMSVLGRPIELILKDDQMKPELAKAMITEAFANDDADIAVGTSWSGGATAMAPVAEQYKKILLVEPAIAESLTGENFNRYLFRASRNSFQDALATAVPIQEGDSVAFLAPDYVYGKDGVAAFKRAMETLGSGGNVVHEEYIPLATTDFTAPMQRIFDAIKDEGGNKYLVVIWGAPNPIPKLAAMRPDRYGIQFLSIGGSNLESMQAWQGFDVGGGAFYYYGFPENEMNDWMVEKNNELYGQPPDLFTAGGFTAAAAIIAALEKAGSTDTEALIAAMEGMEFDTPKGKIMFRKEDHQGIQDQYQFKMKERPEGRWDLLELVRVIKADEMPVPINVAK